jgi:CRISPR/Cas system endoribonuclease Cas6 (RAMP superfamily)
VARLAETLDDTRDLHWHDWTRYSSRQQQEMTLGGALGRWTLRGSADTLAALWPWLWLGQWLHVGKNATMGMGGYTLESTLQ